MKMLTVVPNSANRKLGPGVAATYRPVGATCPRNCPLLGNGCYAQKGHVEIASRKSAKRRDELRKAAGNKLIRHVVAGDWLKPTKDGRRVADRGVLREAIDLHTRCNWLVGWGYTHAPETVARAGFGPRSGLWPRNFRILASCHTAEHKRQLNREGWQTARLIQEISDATADEFICPYDAQKRAGVPHNSRMNCARCEACFDGQRRNIAFLQF